MIPLTVEQVGLKPHFDPWLGNGYRQKLLDADAGLDSCNDGLWHVLGESHYGDASEDTANFTTQVVRNLAFSGYPLFNTILKIVGDLDEVSDPLEQWQPFAYSNFVQVLLPPNERRPSEAAWQSGRDAFFGQLAVTRPKQLLVVGRQSWDELPTAGSTRIPPIIVCDKYSVDDIFLYGYEIAGVTHFTLATWIYHPSSRGLLKPELARERVRSLTIANCKVMNSIERIGDAWYYHPSL